MAKDHAKAVALLAKGCAAQDFQSWTCGSLEKAFDAKDPEAAKAIEAWRQGCAAKDAAACKGLERVELK